MKTVFQWNKGRHSRSSNAPLSIGIATKSGMTKNKTKRRTAIGSMWLRWGCSFWVCAWFLA
jgi:hypothetical protein